MKMLEDTKYVGDFIIDKKSRRGEIILQGGKTNLHIHDEEFFRPDNINEKCIHGILQDKTRLTLIDCNAPRITGTAYNNQESYHFTDIFAHYVLSGDQHIPPHDPTIAAISFTVNDAAAIFYDVLSFGHVLRPGRHIASLLRSNAKVINQHKIPARGKYPQIAYYTGHSPIFRADTVTGEVSAWHNPQTNWGGPEGVHIRNHINVQIKFPRPLKFQNAIESAYQVVGFLDIIAGRPQKVHKIFVHLKKGRKTNTSLAVYSTLPRKINDADYRSLQPSDLPIAAAREPEVFGAVLSKWLDRDATWRDARGRFSNSLSQMNHYSVDRLIGSANMFEILPASALPTAVSISPELESARAAARKIFKKLPESGKRDSILSALGRLNQSSLRDKIEFRSQSIVEKLGNRLDGMPEVIKLAVDCRNHYVHGADSEVDYAGFVFDILPFLTDSLEFVFSASDLIEAGWDVVSFSNQGTTMSHSMGRYLAHFEQNVRHLNEFLPAKWKLGRK